MTDNEIIKAWEKVYNLVTNENYTQVVSVTALREMGAHIKATLDLINRQKAEIERLQKENDHFADIGKLYSEIKAEAIKEFAERLKQKARFCLLDFNKITDTNEGVQAIDNRVKEMVGED